MTANIRHDIYGTIKGFESDHAISRWISDGTTLWECHVIAFIQKYYQQGTHILDVGAFIGLHTIYAAKHIVSEGCKVYAIEAQPEVFKLLRDNTAQCPNVIPMCFAATTYTGLVHVSCPHDYTTFSNPGGLGVVDPWFSRPEFETREVTCMRLDDIHFDDRISVLKMDVEGHECIALTGCARLLAKHKPTLIVEILGGCDRNENQPKILEIIRDIESKYEYRFVEFQDMDYVFVPTNP